MKINAELSEELIKKIRKKYKQEKKKANWNLLNSS